MPPAWLFASKSSAPKPARARFSAAEIPAGPAPTMATVTPFGSAATSGCDVPFSKAKRLISRIPSGAS